MNKCNKCGNKSEFSFRDGDTSGKEFYWCHECYDAFYSGKKDLEGNDLVELKNMAMMEARKKELS